MSLLSDLQTRSESKCELCNAANGLDEFAISFSPTQNANGHIYACKKCRQQMEPDADLDQHHWRCLNESMWSQTPAVQVVAWRMLNALSDEAWARDALDILYLDEETLVWAKSATPPK